MFTTRVGAIIKKWHLITGGSQGCSLGYIIITVLNKNEELVSIYSHHFYKKM